MSSKFCTVVTDVIIEGLSAGHPRSIVCQKAGISYNTLRVWIKDESKAEFATQVERAEALGTMNLVEEIRFHARKDWRAAAWILERTRDAFMTSSRSTAAHRIAMDALARDKLGAEIALIKAKTDALSSSDLSPDEINQIIVNATGRLQAEEDSVH
jgi:hypothetical protein